MVNKRIRYCVVLGCILLGAVYIIVCNRANNKTKHISKNTILSNLSIPKDLPWGRVRYDLAGTLICGDKRLVDLDINPCDPSVPAEKVSRLISSCGCLNASFKDISTPSRQAIHLTATFVAKGKGDEQQYIRLLSATGKCLGIVEVGATIVPRFAITPEVIDFQTVRHMKMSKRNVTITSNVYPVNDWTVVEVPYWASLSITTPTPNTANIDCKLEPTILPGSLDAQVRLVPNKITDDEVILHIIGNVQGEIRSEPETLLIGPVIAGKRGVAHFHLQKTGTKNNIGELVAQGSTSGLQITLQKDNKQDGWNGTVVLQNTATSGSIQRGEILIFDTEGRKYLRIPYRITLI